MSPPSPLAGWHKYTAFLRIGALGYLAHRGTVVLVLTVFAVECFVHSYLWRAVFAGRSEVAGYTLAQMLTYVILTRAVRSFFNNHADREIGALIRSGDIASRMVLPMHFQLAKMAQIYGRAFSRLLTNAIPLTVIMALILPLLGPASALHGLLFLVSALASLALYTSLNFLTATTAFYTEGYTGICNVKGFLVALLSGMYIPFAFFPDPLRLALEWLPFRGMADLPLSLYLGKVTLTQGIGLLLVQFAWVAVLYGLGQAFWNYSVRHAYVEGG